MMGRGRSTLILFIVFVAIASYSYFIEQKRPSRADAESAKERAFSVESENIAELQINLISSQTHLEKRDDTWHITDPTEATADAATVSSITSSLESLNIERVVQDNSDNLAKFGLGKPRLEVTFKHGDTSDPTTLLVGDDAATGSNTYATIKGSDRVFLIAASLGEGFSKTTFDLRDKAILQPSLNAVDQLTWSSKDNQIEVTRREGTWRMVQPWNAYAETAVIDGLISQLRNTSMQSIVTSNPSNLLSYNLAEPLVAITVGGGDTSATLHLGNEADENMRHARDLSRSLVFTVNASLFDAFAKPPADYRRKEVFNFQPFSATHLNIEGRETTVTYEKRQDPETGAVWEQVNIQRKDIDQTRIIDMLSRLSALRATRFIDFKKPHLDPPETIVTVRFGEPEREDRVTFMRSNNTVYALMANEDGGAVVNTSEFEEVIAMIDVQSTAGRTSSP